MKLRIALLAILAAFLVILPGCDSADNPIAPTGSVITITANPTQISLNGQSSAITITGFRPDGNPLNPGTQLTLSTSNGLLRKTNSINGEAANLVEVQDGRATVYLFGEGRQGTATITVGLTSGGDAATATVDVQIGADDSSKPTVEVTANPSEVDLGQQSTITVTAKNADGSPLVGGQAIVRTTLGTVTFDAGDTTDSNGQVTATLLSTSQSGQAMVTATVGASDTAEATVEIGTTRKPTVTLNANPSTVDIGEPSEITVTARDSNGNLLVGTNTAVMTADRGTLSGSGFSSGELRLQNGRGSVTYTAAGPAGDGDITAFVGNSDIATITMSVRDIPTNVTLNLSDNRVAATGVTTLTATVTVVNVQGETIPNEPVDFDFPESSVSAVFGANPVFTGQTGQGQTTIRFDSTSSNLPDSGQTFSIRASVRGGVVDVQTITVGDSGGGN